MKVDMQHFIDPVDMIILKCCKRMRALEISQYKEFTTSSEPVGKVVEDLSECETSNVSDPEEEFLDRLSEFKSDVSEFTCYIDSKEMVDNLQGINSSIYEISSLTEFKYYHCYLDEVD
jgi:hypothetical protein